MKKTLSIALAFLPLALFAQRLEVIASGGQYLAREGISITATIGEVCVGRPLGDESYASEGFQQGFKASPDLPGLSADRENAHAAIEGQIFPNPAIDRVQVVIQNKKGQSVRLQLYNALGLLVKETETTNEVHAFDVSTLAAGQYWIALQLEDDSPFITLPFTKITR